MQLEQRLCSHPELKAEYVKFMEEYCVLDHMQLALDQSTDKDGCYYMPHHAVNEGSKYDDKDTGGF